MALIVFHLLILLQELVSIIYNSIKRCSEVKKMYYTNFKYHSIMNIYHNINENFVNEVISYNKRF